MIKENDIVKYVCNNFNKFFKDLKFVRTEFSLRNFRVDIFATYKDENTNTWPSVFFEVKHQSYMRDLLFELNKQIKFRDWYNSNPNCLCHICVLSDKFEDSMLDFFKDNNIRLFKYSYDNDDLNTLKIEEVIL